MNSEELADKDIAAGTQFASGMNAALRDYWNEMKIIHPDVFYMAFTGNMFGNIVAHVGKKKALMIIDAMRSAIVQSDLDKKADQIVGTA